MILVSSHLYDGGWLLPPHSRCRLHAFTNVIGCAWIQRHSCNAADTHSDGCHNFLHSAICMHSCAYLNVHEFTNFFAPLHMHTQDGFHHIIRSAICMHSHVNVFTGIFACTYRMNAATPFTLPPACIHARTFKHAFTCSHHCTYTNRKAATSFAELSACIHMCTCTCMHSQAFLHQCTRTHRLAATTSLAVPSAQEFCTHTATFVYTWLQVTSQISVTATAIFTVSHLTSQRNSTEKTLSRYHMHTRSLVRMQAKGATLDLTLPFQ